MVIYILKFSCCLFLFMLFYKLFLEKESFHGFKRVYLLGALLLSMSIPLITFIEYVEATPITNSNAVIAELVTEQTSMAVSWRDYVPNILWTIYLIGVILFSIRFAINLRQLFLRIKNNQKLKDKNITKVLLLDNISPHTFFRYIFLNKHKYESNAIPQEVLLHEQTHAQQLHALDILLIEIVQIIFWFNPLLLLLKKDIKLNHEFLADQAVLSHNISALDYQNILLAFSSNVQHPQLANAINYSLIKKRFTVMKTQTSKTAAWIRSLVLLPLLAFMVYGFSSTKEIITTSEDYDENTSDLTARSIEIMVYDDGTYNIDGIKADRNSLVSTVNSLHQDITAEIRNDIMNIHVSGSYTISNEEMWFIYNSLKDYGFHRLVSDNQEVVKSKGNTPFKEDTVELRESNFREAIKVQQSASREQMKAYNTWAKKINEQMAMAEKSNNSSASKPYPVVRLEDVEKYKYIYSIMSDKQRQDAEPFPELPPPPPVDPEAPKIAEKLNEVLPPPPPPIPENATKEEKLKYEKAMKDYKVKAAKVEKQLYKEKQLKLKEKENEKRLKEKQIAERKAISEEQKARIAHAEVQRAELAEVQVQRERERVALAQDRKRLEKERRAEVAKREALREEEVRRRKDEMRERINRPPSPQDPIDHVVDMAKKGAHFYLEGNPISSDLAVETIKSNKKVSIETIKANSSQPEVYITTGPPVIKD